jgi:F0F1-type ATP synthase membrane subunit b/b'
MPCYKLLNLGIALLLSVSCISISNAQEKKNPFADNIIGTLANPKMAGELELLEEQQESIKELMEEFGQLRHEVGQDMKEIWEAAGDEERKEIGKEYWRRIEEGRLDIVKQMKANLLPHQIDRVEQLSAQRMMTEGKGRESAGLLSAQMINYLDIGENQKQRIQDKSAKLKKEVTEKIQKILEDAKQELLAELNADQKKKYEKLLGDPVANENGGDDKDRKRRAKKR